jgi:hypothetical protein
MIARSLVAFSIGATALILTVGQPAAPAQAQDCDSTSSIVPMDGSFSYSITPICDVGQAAPDPVVVVIGADDYGAGPSLRLGTSLSGAVVNTGSGSSPGFTRPGDTAYVNGQPVRTPYSNVSSMTPSQASSARAQGNSSATSQPYSGYGGFTPPARVPTAENQSQTLRGY